MKFFHEIVRRHVQTGIEFQFVSGRHHELDVSATDIDDENVAFHRTLPAGALLPASAEKTFEKAAALRFFGSSRGPAFNNFELDETEQRQACEP